MTGNEIDKYRFPKTLTEQRRIFGLPLDEAIPIFIVGGLMIWMKKYLFALVVAALLWFFIRKVKKGKGSMWLYNLAYWYLPSELWRVVYKIIPDSCFRQWTK